MRKIDDPLVKEIFDLFEIEDYRGILTKIRHVAQSCDKSLISSLHSLTWPAPTESDLEFFSSLIEEHSVERIYSIGCGSGLLEWLILKVLKERRNSLENILTGIEIDFGWWSSVYAPPTFLPLLYVDKDFNATEPFGSPADLVLFCYFNNLKVFLEYLGMFRGKYVAILGPVSNTQFCAPAPLELEQNPEMPCDEWKLIVFKPFGIGNIDHIAVYQRN